jgi:DNA-directed RNA polymerase sigma subunit (sigma70/sigma32)
MGMEHNKVTEILKNFRCYEYAAKNCGEPADRLPYAISDRKHMHPDTWDQCRYNRIVTLIRGAVDHVLSDDQRTIIMRKYLDRNPLTLNEISTILHRERTTVSRWHTEAIRKLAIALEPLSDEEAEITEFNHRFDPAWAYHEPKITA